MTSGWRRGRRSRRRRRIDVLCIVDAKGRGRRSRCTTATVGVCVRSGASSVGSVKRRVRFGRVGPFVFTKPRVPKAVRPRSKALCSPFWGNLDPLPARFPGPGTASWSSSSVLRARASFDCFHRCGRFEFEHLNRGARGCWWRGICWWGCEYERRYLYYMFYLY